jgi:hypothetical protein
MAGSVEMVFAPAKVVGNLPYVVDKVVTLCPDCSTMTICADHLNSDASCPRGPIGRPRRASSIPARCTALAASACAGSRRCIGPTAPWVAWASLVDQSWERCTLGTPGTLVPPPTCLRTHRPEGPKGEGGGSPWSTTHRKGSRPGNPIRTRLEAQDFDRQAT